eukprot:4450262-Prymnesium_polylepis.1
MCDRASETCVTGSVAGSRRVAFLRVRRRRGGVAPSCSGIGTRQRGRCGGGVGGCEFESGAGSSASSQPPARPEPSIGSSDGRTGAEEVAGAGPTYSGAVGVGGAATAAVAAAAQTA